jgi:hypothetical protein
VNLVNKNNNYDDPATIAATVAPSVYRITTFLQNQSGWTGMGLVLPMEAAGTYFPIGNINTSLASTLHEELLSYVRLCKQNYTTIDMRKSENAGETAWKIINEVGGFQGIIILALSSVDGSEREEFCLAHIISAPGYAQDLWKVAEQVLLEDGQ